MIIRPARIADIPQMGGMLVQCWQEAYRGLMPDAVLDDPGLPAARERMWTAALTGERYGQNRVAVAERDEELAGVAMSGATMTSPAPPARFRSCGRTGARIRPVLPAGSVPFQRHFSADSARPPTVRAVLVPRGPRPEMTRQEETVYVTFQEGAGRRSHGHSRH